MTRLGRKFFSSVFSRLPAGALRAGRHLYPLLDRNTAYDCDTVEVMAHVLSRTSNCVDVGAHKGKVLRHMLTFAPEGNHFAFEPLPQMATKLRKHNPTVTVHEVALSDREGFANFQFVENAPAYSGLRRRLYDRADPQISTIQVKVTTLDSILPDEHPVALIKLDIEGGEYHAIRGGLNTIRRCKPILIFEADMRSTGQYEVSADDMFELLTRELEYEISTMSRWLKGQPPFFREEFRVNWLRGPDYYFIATPKA